MSLKRVTLVAGCAAITLSACTSGPSRVTIGVSVPNTKSALVKAMLSGAREEARRQGAVLAVSDANGNEARQATGLVRFLDQEVDAIVVDAAGSGSVVDAMQRAGEAEVPVIAVRDVVPGVRATTSVVSEDVVAGRLAAEYLFFLMGGTGSAAELVPKRPGAASQGVQRGFREIASRTTTVTIEDRRTAPVDRSGAASVASRVFEANPELKGVFAGTDEIALGVTDAARRLGILGRVVVVGVGGTTPALQAVRAERLEGSVRLNAEELGRVAIHAAVRAARGDPVPRRQVVDVTLVTERNAKKFLP